ncbi:MAG: peptidase M20 [Deltaproteobacteria bacterium CG11_big_fil_rev_8_21_14_0_20_47_16]|nr:MAG: peptidase M20 [Deltaproteobacteria bacterium CG11_big_fil_rev_8_21_14_0_20_47_16]
MQTVIDYIRSTKEAALKELLDYLKIPSISANPEYHPQCDQAANYLADKLKSIGMENVQLITGYGRPNVYADWLHAPGKPTILIYGHYDVQPPDPLEKWTTPPFEPTIRDDMIYARGSDDNKGQHWPWVRAIEAWLKTEKKLPVNIKFVAEGEEECGGKAIHDCMQEKKYIDAWKCDAAAISDGAWFAHDVPSIGVGLRGLSYFELEVNGAKMDLHSGQHGGTGPNPIKVLAQVIAKLNDVSGRVAIPGFYDDVQELTAAERKMIHDLPFDVDNYHTEIGVATTAGEEGYSHLERQWTRPTFEVHGIVGGYVAPGAKTVIPATATAKISFRLVPNQNPAKIKKQFEDFLKANMPKTVTWSLKELGEGGTALVVPTDSPYLKALQPVYEKIWGRSPMLTRTGGSIPVATLFANTWKIPVLFMDLGYHDDQIHSPNERYPLKQFYDGMELAAQALDAWSKI